ncbi:putative CoA-substrate-specific enzyme activase [Desulfobotulus alkaliphilus]|uniref:Putative CoA-substrate-specific enzyme activase n=1 Tax=Desulfobotulus alkaliphilus TaxID=622671 RepID=A0A562RVU7_9BACT|nr:acyl-CoA dehydratase activase [Desulfobotulus alkaliphilus]TWI73088.1 putative CoA-substrate-specific enzyme activase [Desulfobotulus alkaliphilus]
MHTNDSWVLGVDVGSVTIGMALVAKDGRVGRTACRFHHGEIVAGLEALFKEFGEDRPLAVVTTGRAQGYFDAQGHFDERVALIAAVRQRHPEARTVLVVGGETFGRVLFDGEGEYQSYRGNTSCAAGTGSFLDQQAGRLGFSGAAQLAEMADSHKGETPKIASRCAVFAKTDLIHAQQEGYSQAGICDGLCEGLARNVVDTVLSDGAWKGPVVMAGGVAANAAVRRHMETLAGEKFILDPMAHLLGAIGAALHYHSIRPSDALPAGAWPPALHARREKKGAVTHYDPLTLEFSPWPEFGGLRSYIFHPVQSKGPDVEVELYELPESFGEKAHIMGVDIGSTSTKAVLITGEGEVSAGFYTRTQGRPVAAICAILEALDGLRSESGVSLPVTACATTGSGRKFVGGILGADLILDEITAHAKAACSLNPSVDTIIEIGGQDAKFTTLKDGRVTSSIMNNVCAAGTGSFIEEQAQKLGVSIRDYARLTEGVAAPLSSDRCTVFMERDLNHYLAEGFSVEEVLASALHSVRENYLLKVATESRIGEVVFFQGATARNRSLVAAFEQRLKKPIFVSPYCHLTGALGAALSLGEALPEVSAFRGVEIYKNPIPIETEVCTLCTNHCKLTVAQVAGAKVAYGFLCGRDYETENYVNSNRTGFSLKKVRQKVLRFTPSVTAEDEVSIGLPAALHLYEDQGFWKVFFDRLGFPVKSSEDYTEGVRSGKVLAGAEFCAPMSAMHGHVAWLLEKTDYVFLPFYFEERRSDKAMRRQYCYYTQFAPSLASLMDPERVLRPTVRYLYPDFHTKMELYRMLRRISRRDIGFLEVSRAWDAATRHKEECRKGLHEIGEKAREGEDIRVMLLGRPYNVLPAWSNKGIPEIFESLGVRPFFQDMLGHREKKDTAIQSLLETVHWRYAARILAAVEETARTPGLYPVFVTAFKCAPDSFILDYAKAILEAWDKPYLVLELDEHDSSVGYETRIEAAIRAFRNHHEGHRPPAALPVLKGVNPDIATDIEGKTLVLPNWDPVTCRLLAANLRREGLRVVVLEESDAAIRRSLRFNTGQCIPVNAIAEEYVEAIDRYDLNPEDTVLWMMNSDIACNIKLYPHHIKTLLARYGEKYGRAGVFVGELSFLEVSMRTAFNTYFACLFGGLLRKLACKIRPREKLKGMTDAVLEKALTVMESAFMGEKDKEDAAREVAAMFSSIPQEEGERVKVAVFGDLYVRDNDVMNQNLVRFIESHGGEVLPTAYSDYARMTAEVYFRKWFNEGKYRNLISYKPLLATLSRLEWRYYRHFESLIGEPRPEYDMPPEEILKEYGVSIENTGESLDNLLKVFYLHRHHPDLGLFVQASPAFCCASLVTEAMAGKIEEKTGVPVVSITYDGTGGFRNQDLVPYLTFPRKAVMGKKILKKAL